jgi:glycosyltransferase involved in cell wall biosynthesis
MQRKKVLIITYYWPPSGGPGVQRWLKFAKYLPDNNIEPIIICPHPDKAEYPILDKSLYSDVDKDLQVHTTDNKSFYHTYKKFTKAKTAPYSGFANDANPSFKQKISRFIRGNFFLPDSRKGWNQYAYAKAEELIEKYNIETVITTSPPHSTQLVGLALKKKYKIKWIADMRDPWTDIYYYNNFYPTALAKYVDKIFERRVLENADYIISVSEFIKKQFELKSEKIKQDKILVIPNGYDKSDFPKQEQEKDSLFTISYTGTLAANYDISTLVKVLKEFKGDYLLQFVGKVDENVQKHITSELGDKAIFRGFVPHSESIKTLVKSDILLLVIPLIKDNEGILTGKLFEYIGSGKKILCLGPKHGDAAKIITHAEAGITCDYSDTEVINNFINRQYESRDTNDSPKKEIYSREGLTQELSTYL